MKRVTVYMAVAFALVSNGACVAAERPSTKTPRVVMNIVNFVRALDPRKPKPELLRALREEHCRYSAIKVLEEKTVGGKKTRRPAVDTSKCIGCGACAHCCPAHVIAITAKEGSLG